MANQIRGFVRRISLTTPSACALAAWAGMLIALSPIAAIASPQFTPLGPLPGGGFSTASAVSPDGRFVVGTSNLQPSSSYLTNRPIRWSVEHGLQNLGTLPASLFEPPDFPFPLNLQIVSYGRGISTDGSTVVGYSMDDSAFGSLGFRWTASEGIRQIEPLPGARYARAEAVNANGSVIVGSSGDQAFRWTAAGGTQPIAFLPGVNTAYAVAVSADGNTVIGSNNSSSLSTFRWTAQGGTEELAGSAFMPSAANADCSVIVGSTDPSGHNSRAVRWTDAQGLIDLGVLAGYDLSWAGAISPNGTMVGGGCTVFGNRDLATATIWTAELGLIDLSLLLPTLGIDLAGWQLENISGISLDERTLVGNGLYNGEYRGFIITNLPTPGTTSVLVLLAAFAARRRRC